MFLLCFFRSIPLRNPGVMAELPKDHPQLSGLGGHCFTWRELPSPWVAPPSREGPQPKADDEGMRRPRSGQLRRYPSVSAHPRRQLGLWWAHITAHFSFVHDHCADPRSSPTRPADAPLSPFLISCYSRKSDVRQKYCRYNKIPSVMLPGPSFPRLPTGNNK